LAKFALYYVAMVSSFDLVRAEIDSGSGNLRNDSSRYVNWIGSK